MTITRTAPLALLLLGLAAAPGRTQDEPAAPAATDAEALDAWLAGNAQLETWSADVVQTRESPLLTMPLRTTGRVVFAQPNRFRWQLLGRDGEPRSEAVRTEDALWLLTHRWKTAERYADDAELGDQWKHALTLLEVGFPSEPERFHEQYVLEGLTQTETTRRFELSPRSEGARTLLQGVALEVAKGDQKLLATELTFPDGSTIRNEFSNHDLSPTVDESAFEVRTEGWTVTNPLEG